MFVNFKSFIPVNRKKFKYKFFWSKFDQSFSKKFDLLEGGSQYTLVTIINCGRWSEMVEVKLWGIVSGEIILERILSLNVSEWLASQVG